MSDRLIDCDVHCAVPETSALFPYLPEHWCEFLAASGFRQPPPLSVTYPEWSPMLATVGAELTVERLREEVLSSAEAAILNCIYGLEAFTHPYLGPAVATALNSWIAAEWLDAEPRLLANAAVTPQHGRAAVAEIERIAGDPRFVGVLLPSRSPQGYGSERYWPILDAIAENDLVLTLNAGGMSGTPTTAVNWLENVFEDHTAHFLGFEAQVMSLVFSGIFERHPNLRVVLAESGWTWLPAVMWRMDQEWRSFQREVPWLTAAPSEYVRRHFRMTVQPADAPADTGQLLEVLAQLGSSEMLLYASDHPHRYAESAERLLAAVAAEDADRIRYANALDTYGRAGRSGAVQSR